MNNTEAIALLNNEIKCVTWADGNLCNRDCGRCELLKDAKDIVEAEEMAIKALSITHCIDCKYYDAPLCKFHRISYMTSRKGFCHHGVKGAYVPVKRKSVVEKVMEAIERGN